MKTKCYNSLIRQFDELKNTGLVKRHRGNATVSNFGLLLVVYYGFWQKWVKILIVPLFWLKFDDATVALSLIVFHEFFLYKLTLYYLTSYRNLLRLNVIFTVRKIGQILLNEKGVEPPPDPRSNLFCLILRPRR